jgi:hypothetical protein
MFVFSKDTYAPANLSFAFAVRSRLAVTSSAFDFGEEEREREEIEVTKNETIFYEKASSISISKQNK